MTSPEMALDGCTANASFVAGAETPTVAIPELFAWADVAANAAVTVWDPVPTADGV